MTFDYVELFGGAGGMTRGFRDCGLNGVAVEWDADACATRETMGYATIHADVREIAPIPAAGLGAAPSCQTFSLAGKGSGRAEMDKILAALNGKVGVEFADDRTGMVVVPMNWILNMYLNGTPYEWIVMEQVPAVLPIWREYGTILERYGYSAVSEVLSCEQFGVAQTRKRAIFVAKLRGKARMPKPTHSRYYPRDPKKLDVGVLPWVSMAEALGEGEVIRPRGMLSAGGNNTAGQRERPPTEPSATITGKGTAYWQLRSDNRPNSASRPIDAPAPTILGNGERGTHAAWVGPETLRVTVEEAAILQSAPGHKFQGTKTSRYQQCGNMTPPALAAAVLAELLRPE